MLSDAKASLSARRSFVAKIQTFLDRGKILNRLLTKVMIKLKRIYGPYDKKDGYRVLVDRLWPRGVSKEKAHLDVWLKDVAPSTELRKWFNHDPKRWADFKKKYRVELKKNKEAVLMLKQAKKKNSTITLLYGAKDEMHNEAVVIKDSF